MSSNFCEFGICKEDQHCCGDNVCCSEVDFAYLLDLLFVTLIIIIIGLLLLGLSYKYIGNVKNLCRKLCGRCSGADYILADRTSSVPKV